MPPRWLNWFKSNCTIPSNHLERIISCDSFVRSAISIAAMVRYNDKRFFFSLVCRCHWFDLASAFMLKPVDNIQCANYAENVFLSLNSNGKWKVMKTTTEWNKNCLFVHSLDNSANGLFSNAKRMRWFFWCRTHVKIE